MTENTIFAKTVCYTKQTTTAFLKIKIKNKNSKTVERGGIRFPGLRHYNIQMPSKQQQQKITRYIKTGEDMGHSEGKLMSMERVRIKHKFGG